MALMDRFRYWRDRRRSAREMRAAFDRRIDAIVEAVDPRLRMVAGYRATLAPALRTASRAIDALVATLPPPLEVSRDAWSRTPLLRAAFTGPDAMQQLFDGHRALRRFLASAAARDATAIYAGLGMSLEITQRFGHALHGDVVQRDVAQQALTLGDHRLSAFAGDAAGLADALRERVVQELVLTSTRTVFAARQRREELTEERIKLQMRLRMYEQEARGMAPFWQDVEVLTRHADDLRAQLAATDGALEELRANAADIGDYLDMTAAVFAGVGDKLTLEPRALYVDAMNLVHDGPGEGISALPLTVVHAEGRAPRAFTLVRFDPDFVRVDAGDGLRQAARALGVH